MKTKLQLFCILSILLLSSQIFASDVSITSPNNNGTLYITSGTTRSITMEWDYSVSPGYTWYFKVYRLGSWVTPSEADKITVDNISSGSYTWKVRLYLYNQETYNTTYEQDEVTFNVAPATYSITAQNNFSGGQIKVGVNGTPITKTSPYVFSATINNIVNLEAIENQSNGGYNWIWNDLEAPLNKSDWGKREDNNWGHFDYNQATNFTVNSTDDNAIYQANLRKVCSLTFTNSFNGISSTGSIKVNGTTVSAPATYQVVDQNTITVEASTYTEADVEYTFSHWSDNNSTQNPRTITATSHANISAVYVGTPIFTNYYDNNRNLHFNTYNPRIQQFVTLYWNEHVSSNVTSYKIYRSNKSLGETYFIYIGSVSRGTTSFQDADYYLTSSSGGTELKYDVRAYYSPDQTASDGGYVSVRGTSAQINKTANTDSTSTELPAINEYALNSNYPNPFNPTTQISYQIPENSFVNLVVYNALGQKVAELVNQNQSVGQYSVKFDASNLPSGIYIYKLQTDNFSDVKKMLLTK